MQAQVILKKYGTLRMTGVVRQGEETEANMFERSELFAFRAAGEKTTPTRRRRPRDVAKQLASKGGDDSVAMCRAFLVLFWRKRVEGESKIKRACSFFVPSRTLFY